VHFVDEGMDSGPIIMQKAVPVLDDDTEETLVNVEEKVYTIVGEIERWNYETYTSPGYIVMTYMENIDDKVNVSVLYNEPKEYIEINKNICANTGLNEEIDTYLGIKPDILDASTLAKYKMAILLQFVLSGNQSIYYGSERFMWGGDVPHNRKPMIWEELMVYEDESDIISKYSSQKTVLDTKVVYDEVENRIR
jgi:hypothetical protein